MDKKQILSRIDELKKQLVDAEKKEVERRHKRLLDRIKKSGLLDKSDEELDLIFATLSASPVLVPTVLVPVQAQTFNSNSI